MRGKGNALAMVCRGAEIQGYSVSDFVGTATQEAAQKAVSEIKVIRLSCAAQEQFVKIVTKPPVPVVEETAGAERIMIGAYTVNPIPVIDCPSRVVFFVRPLGPTGV